MDGLFEALTNLASTDPAPMPDLAAEKELPLPAIIVIFGITGDLAQRKLMPALYHLFRDNLLDERTVIIGVTRRDVSTDEMIHLIGQSVSAADGETCQLGPLKKLQAALRMVTMSQTDPAEYRALWQQMEDIEAAAGTCMNRLYYLSVPPQMFGPIIRNLGSEGLSGSCSHKKAASRLLIEKPFGYDLASARELAEDINKCFSEEQIYLIDHYIAKDAVQNIVSFRQENPEVEKMWNGRHVESITITVFEKLAIEGRAIFYDAIGALRDFVQSHLIQMLSLVAMNLPESDSSQAEHTERLKLLQSVTPITAEKVKELALRGQYEGYREEVEDDTSVTETFARLQLSIENERWRDTKVILQTGKAMAEKTAYVELALRSDTAERQTLKFFIQPEKGIVGKGVSLEPLQPLIHDFNETHPGPEHNPLGYEAVLVRAIDGDHTLFTSAEEIIAAWEIVDGVVAAWAESGTDLHIYQKGIAELKL